MVVEFKRTKSFGQLTNGAFFRYAGSYYIKMAYDIGEEGDFLNAVDIANGFPAFFVDEDEVIEYPKAKVVIE